MWQQWTNVLLGLWIIASPFVFTTTNSLTANLIISGIITAILAIWGAVEHQSRYGIITSNREHRHA